MGSGGGDGGEKDVGADPVLSPPRPRRLPPACPLRRGPEPAERGNEGGKVLARTGSRTGRRCTPGGFCPCGYCWKIALRLVEYVCIIHISCGAIEQVLIDCTVRVQGRTGVEMEALTGASMAALCIYDMCKATSHDILIKVPFPSYIPSGQLVARALMAPPFFHPPTHPFISLCFSDLFSHA